MQQRTRFIWYLTENTGTREADGGIYWMSWNSWWIFFFAIWGQINCYGSNECGAQFRTQRLLSEQTRVTQSKQTRLTMWCHRPLVFALEPRLQQPVGGSQVGAPPTSPVLLLTGTVLVFGDAVKLSEAEWEKCSHWCAAAAMEGTTTQPDAALHWTAVRFFFLLLLFYYYYLKGSHQPWGVLCLLCSCWSLRDTFLEVRRCRGGRKHSICCN